MVALYRDKSMDAFSRGRTVDESMCNDQRLKSKHMFLYVDWMYIYIMYVRRTTCMIWFSITEDCYLRWWFSIVQKIWLCCSKKACYLLILGCKMHVHVGNFNKNSNLWETKQIEKTHVKEKQSHAQDNIYVVRQFAYVHGVAGISL